MNHAISIIIPSVGNLQNYKTLLESIKKAKSDILSIEVFVVLNGVSLEVYTKFQNEIQNYDFKINIENLPIKGVNRARNYGLNQAKNEIIFFLDDDCEIISKNTFLFHIQQHHKNPHLFALGGGYALASDAGNLDVMYNEQQMSWLLSGIIDDTQLSKKTRHLIGGNFSLKKSILEKNKLYFDEAIVYGGSEHDFFNRAHLLGLELELCDLEVTHHTHENFFSISKKVFKQGQGKRLIELKFQENSLLPKGESLETRNKSKSLAQLLFNYCFWWGYYWYDHQLLKFFLHVIKDLFGYLNYKRFDILKKISKD